MTEKLIYILKIILYFINVFLIYIYICKKNKSNKSIKEKNKFGIIAIIFFGIIMGYYSTIGGNLSDRFKYGNFFSNSIYNYIIKNQSMGLYYFYMFLHMFSYNRYVLFFSVNFIYWGITLYAYNKYDDVHPLAILLLGMSTYSTFGLLAFKQCFSVALVSLSWGFYSRRKIKSSIVTLVLAIMFHESAFIVILMYLCLSTTNKSNLIRICVYLMLAMSVIFYNSITTYVSKILYFIPGMEEQMEGYFNNSDKGQQLVNYFTIIKGIPFYIITLCAIIKRNKLKSIIKNYDGYLTLCVFCAIINLMSFYMYWMWRFALYCYFPVFVFFSQILYHDNNIEKNKGIMYSTTFLLFILMLRYLIQCYFIYGGIY